MVASDMRNGTTGDVMQMTDQSSAPTTELEMIDVTPDLARTWLERMRFPGQRPVRERQVQYLAREIAQGRFRLSTIDLRECDGRLYLVNGQHRLHAVVRADATVPMVVVRRCAPSLEDVARDYATFDRGLVRSHADGLLAYGLDGETGMNVRQVRIMSSAAPLLMGGFQAGRIGVSAVSTQERAGFVRAWAAPGVHAFATIGESNLARVRKLYNGSTFAVVLATFRYAPERAEAFWGRLVDNDGLRQGDPELTLIDLLVDRLTGATARQTYASRAVAACWNASVQGRTLRLVKVMDPLAPIRILETPFDGTRHLAYDELP